MIKKRNTIRKLTLRNIHANKKRNLVIMTAIAVTVFMFTSVLSVGMGIVKTLETHSLRMNGAVGHTSLTNPTPEQVQMVYNSGNVESVGLRYNIGRVLNDRNENIDISLVYFDETLINDIFSPAWTDITGQYPQGVNEIMASRELLESFGIYNPRIGMGVILQYFSAEQGFTESEFILSGFYTDYDWVSGKRERNMLVSHEFAMANNITNPAIMYFTETQQGLLAMSLNLSIEQAFKATTDYTQSPNTFILYGLILFFILIAAYLLIFNILNISVSQDVRFFGLLKALGASAGQIRGVVYGQVLILSVIAIPIGLLLGMVTPFILVPLLTGEASAVISFPPFIYIGGAVLALIAIITGASSPAQKAERTSPIEAVKYSGDINTKVKARFPTRGKPFRMALRNISRDRKRGVIMILSLSLGIFIFTFISTYVNSMDISFYSGALAQAENDFVIYTSRTFYYNETRNYITEEFIDSIRDLPGVINVYPTVYTIGKLEYQPAFDPYIDRVLSSQTFGGMAREVYLNRSFICHFVGIDTERLEVFESVPWNIEAWKQGEFAIILSEAPENFVNLQRVDGRLFDGLLPEEERSRTIDDFPHSFSIPIGGVMPYHPFHGYHMFGRPGERDIWGVELLVSDNYLTNLITSYGFEPPAVVQLSIESDHDYDESLLKTLGEMVENLPYDYHVELTSQARIRLMFASNQRFINIIGLSISIILFLTGVQNFISSMSASLIIRKKEFAILESIGMSRIQLLLMLIYEGMIYAVTTLSLGIGIGTAAIIFGYRLFEALRENMIIFSYPAIPITSMVLIILLICISISIIMCLIVQRDSVVDRLKEGV